MFQQNQLKIKLDKKKEELKNSVYIDLSGIDGFLWISNISWAKISNLKEVLPLFDEVENENYI